MRQHVLLPTSHGHGREIRAVHDPNCALLLDNVYTGTAIAVGRAVRESA